MARVSLLVCGRDFGYGLLGPAISGLLHPALLSHCAGPDFHSAARSFEEVGLDLHAAQSGQGFNGREVLARWKGVDQARSVLKRPENDPMKVDDRRRLLGKGRRCRRRHRLFEGFGFDYLSASQPEVER